MDLYVYYKVQAADTAALREAVIAMQARLTAAHGVAPQLKRRPPAAHDAQTWMEVYPDVAGEGFIPALQAAVTQAGLTRWIAGPRHNEVFEDLPPCA